MKVIAHRQDGAALIVALIILAVMTLLGVTAMSQSGLELLMAGNMQTQTHSMSEAENALAASEHALTNSTGAGVDYHDFDEDIDPVALLTGQASSRSEFSDSYIEYLGPRTVPGNSIVVGRETPRAGSEIHLFRNTAIYQQGDSGARRLLQSIYVTETVPTRGNSGAGNGG